MIRSCWFRTNLEQDRITKDVYGYGKYNKGLTLISREKQDDEKEGLEKFYLKNGTAAQIK